VPRADGTRLFLPSAEKPETKNLCGGESSRELERAASSFGNPLAATCDVGTFQSAAERTRLFMAFDEKPSNQRYVDQRSWSCWMRIFLVTSEYIIYWHILRTLALYSNEYRRKPEYLPGGKIY